MRKFSTIPVLVLLLLFFACQKDVTDTNQNQASAVSFPPGSECGTPVSKDLFDMGGVADRGDLQIGNDGDNIIVWAGVPPISGGPTQVKKIIAVYGSYDHVVTIMNESIIWTPCQGPLRPDRVKVSAPGLTEDSIHIPNTAFQSDNCVWMALYVTLTDNSGFEWCTYPKPYDSIIPNISAWKVLVKYCRQDCPQEDCGQLRTQTQGGWGAKPSGNNPGTYLHTNFAAAFPNGLQVGCTNRYMIKFTSASAITDFLPAGGSPDALKESASNPKYKSIKNVLIGQLTALTLNVGFDKYDPAFGEAGKKLGDMIIRKGKFKGKTVSEFLAIANNVLGGCSTAYKASLINEIAEKINENYIDGKKDKGFLVCEIKDCDNDHDDDDDDDDHNGDHDDDDHDGDDDDDDDHG